MPKYKVEKNIIPVIASSDDNYSYPLGIMFISLLENTQNPERFHLFIIDGGISEEKKKNVNLLHKPYNIWTRKYI